MQIIDTHSDFYIVNKPAGVGFHDEQTNEGKITGFFNRVCQHLSEDLFPVHRLDKMTSGLLILARNKACAQSFQTMFEQKQVEKVYIAITDKKPKKKQGSIVGDMSKARGGQWKLLKSQENPAITRFFSWGAVTEDNAPYRLKVLKPETGKTHQLRVACKSLGAPIVGDELYGGSSADRGYLHAFALRFCIQQQSYEYRMLPESGELFNRLTTDTMTKLQRPFELPWAGKK